MLRKEKKWMRYQGRSMKRHLKTAIDAAIAVVSDDDVLYVLDVEKLFHLSTETVAVQKVLLQVVKIVCCTYSNKYLNLEELCVI